MLFQYIGKGEDSPKTCDVYDTHFILNGNPVDVKEEKIIKKLLSNGSFKFEPMLISDTSYVEEEIKKEVEEVTQKRGRPRK